MDCHTDVEMVLGLVMVLVACSDLDTPYSFYICKENPSCGMRFSIYRIQCLRVRYMYIFPSVPQHPPSTQAS